jgi:hypothetical protein
MKGSAGCTRAWSSPSCSTARSTQRWCLRESSEVQDLRSFHHDCVRTLCRISMLHVGRYSTTNRELLGWLGLHTMDTYTLRGGSCSSWGMCGGWNGRGCQGTAHSAGAPVEGKWVGGRELTWGEGVEKALKRASHAFPSADDEPTLCAEHYPLSRSRWLLGGAARGGEHCRGF